MKAAIVVHFNHIIQWGNIKLTTSAVKQTLFELEGWASIDNIKLKSIPPSIIYKIH